VTILGSTGSVGQSTVDLISRDPDAYRIEALVAATSVELLADQARRLHARLAVVADPTCYRALKAALAGTSIEAAAGSEAVSEAAARPAEWVMAAVVGFAGLSPTLVAARRGAMVALANKEALVCAGRLLMDAVETSNGVLLPVDSEHNAIFQVFDPRQRHAVDRLILTASGGPFRNWSLADMADATPEQAVAHPNWSMGDKISVDSATMMNKGLELIEAHLLFGLPAEQVEIIVHPQSVIHSMVAYRDGSVLAQLGAPDMRVPISHALGWPSRIDSPAARLDFANLSALTFERPDSGRFPSLRLAREAQMIGGLAPIVMNAANETAVAAFLAGRIGFLDIARVVEDVMMGWDGLAAPVEALQHVHSTDLEARRRAEQGCQDRSLSN
jgi:1-deoxy-D-xylulose-5-phosphate reductoisomerase